MANRVQVVMTARVSAMGSAINTAVSWAMGRTRGRRKISGTSRIILRSTAANNVARPTPINSNTQGALIASLPAAMLKAGITAGMNNTQAAALARQAYTSGRLTDRELEAILSQYGY